MFGRRKRCRACGDDLEPGVAPQAVGRHGAITVVLDRVPVRQCPQGHVRRMADRDDSALLFLELQDRLPTAHGSSCTWCAAPLGAPGDEITFDLEIVPPSSPPFAITVRTDAGVRCGSCGRTQLPGDPETGFDVAEAVVLAYENQRIER